MTFTKKLIFSQEWLSRSTKSQRPYPCSPRVTSHAITWARIYVATGHQETKKIIIYKLPSFALDKISKNKYEKKEED